MEYIPLNQPYLGLEEQRAVIDFMTSEYRGTGKITRAFEEDFAAWLGIPHAIATTSGTTALLAALWGLGIKPGVKVATTPLSFAATVETLIFLGGYPVFVDIDPATYTIDPKRLAATLERYPDIKGLIVVHLYGLPANMPALLDIASQFGLWVLEDACQSHGAAINGRKVGTFGDVAVFSFYSSKNITTGEGGMVVTANDDIAGRVRSFINHGVSTSDRYLHQRLGLNLRMADMLAAIGRVQLRRLEELNQRRQENASYYLANLNHSSLVLPSIPNGYTHVFHQFTLRVPEREGMIQRLSSAGIGYGVYYHTPLPLQPAIRDFVAEGSSWSEAEVATRSVLSIPVHPSLSEEQLATIVRTINDK